MPGAYREGLWGAGHTRNPTVLCFFSSAAFIFSWESGSTFPFSGEGRQKGEIKHCHCCLVNTMRSAEESSSGEGLREGQGRDQGPRGGENR